jgi:hypothetical protein
MPTELLYVLIAAVIGVLLYRYFSGHGGIQVTFSDYGSLPPEGQITVRQHLVRWRSAEDGSFVAGWQLDSGHVVAMTVDFDRLGGEGSEDADQGVLSLRVDRRTLARGVRWTDQIRDRALRADVEAILKVLAREAKGGQSERARMDAARPVGADAELEDRR